MCYTKQIVGFGSNTYLCNMGNTTDYSVRKQLLIDLIEAYKAVAPLSWTQQEAYERMVKQPAPRYYVTAKQAYQVISPMMKGDFEMVNMMLPRRRRMYYCLFNEVSRMMEKTEFYNKSLRYIMQFAVTRPAPEFFICAERAKHLRLWLKNGVIDAEGKINEERLPSYKKTREYHRNKRKNKKLWMSGQTLEEEETAKQ